MAIDLESPVGNRFVGPSGLLEVLRCAPRVLIPEKASELFELAVGGPDRDYFEVSYDVPGKGSVVEAIVVRRRNGLAVNYTDP